MPWEWALKWLLISLTKINNQLHFLILFIRISYKMSSNALPKSTCTLSTISLIGSSLLTVQRRNRQEPKLTFLVNSDWLLVLTLPCLGSRKPPCNNLGDLYQISWSVIYGISFYVSFWKLKLHLPNLLERLSPWFLKDHWHHFSVLISNYSQFPWL